MSYEAKNVSCFFFLKLYILQDLDWKVICKDPNSKLKKSTLIDMEALLGGNAFYLTKFES